MKPAKGNEVAYQSSTLFRSGLPLFAPKPIQLHTDSVRKLAVPIPIRKSVTEQPQKHAPAKMVLSASSTLAMLSHSDLSTSTDGDCEPMGKSALPPTLQKSSSGLSASSAPLEIRHSAFTSITLSYDLVEEVKQPHEIDEVNLPEKGYAKDF